MITSREEQRHFPEHHRQRLASSTAGGFLTPEQLDELWAAYRVDRSDWRLRNRLVEHYLPFVHKLARSYARKMRLRDKENAVGEVLAALVRYIVPKYDGRNNFHDWARFCTKRTLINQRRAERRAGSIFEKDPAEAFNLNLLPDRDAHGRDLKFLEFTAELSDRQATVLWLRYYRGMSVGEVAGILKIQPGTVQSTACRAIRQLQKKFADATWEEFPLYS